MRIFGIILSLLCPLVIVGCGPITPPPPPPPPCTQKGFWVVDVSNGICGQLNSACAADRSAAIAAVKTIYYPGRLVTLYACDGATVNPASICTLGQPVGTLPAGCGP
jgi:hypothetical protein